MIWQILVFLRFELQRQWKTKATFASAMLFLVAATLVIYFSFLSSKTFPKPVVLNALLWLVIIFSTIQNVYNIFLREKEEHFYYYYYQLSPISFVFGKWISSSLWGVLGGLLTWVLFWVTLDFEVVNIYPVLVSIILGSVGLSALFTLNGAISIQAGGNVTLMAVLSFPLLIPLLLYAVGLTFDGIVDGTQVGKSSLVLFSMDVLIVLLMYVLYPFLWKE